MFIMDPLIVYNVHVGYKHVRSQNVYLLFPID